MKIELDEIVKHRRSIVIPLVIVRDTRAVLVCQILAEQIRFQPFGRRGIRIFVGKTQVCVQIIFRIIFCWI